ncbi:MAG: universal stress protein [Micropruina sp.]|uniref:universal stress protein n=1 Tax=Micropruina sp. TaxID=2737536 RepID=UPI0039E47AFB
MSSPIVVGYTATKRGRDAVVFAARLAAALSVPLDVAVILPAQGRSVITPPDASYDRHLHTLAQQWLDEAIGRLPHGVAARPRIASSDSFAEGLIDLAHDVDAGHIVVGAGGGGLRGRHRLGTTSTELLYSSDVPVVLVPRGARKLAAETPITRLTVAVGPRPDGGALAADAAALASTTGVGVRLLSLLAIDLPVSADTAAIRLAHSTQASEVLAATNTALPQGMVTEVVVADGDSIESAVAALDWQPGELLLAGSGRLAQPRRLFLGSTVGKMLHEVPVPVVVVPRAHHHEGADV